MSHLLFTPDQVRAMDVRTIERGVTGAVLMERAAGHLARHTVALAGHGYGLRVGIVCGTGNNGGDGLALARRLMDAGAHARVAVVGGADRLHGLPAVQRDLLLAHGGRIVDTLEGALADADVAVDCLLGTGARGAPRGGYVEAVQALLGVRDRGAPVLACDQPTGVDAATGDVPGQAVAADRTVVLGAEKVGLRLWPARGQCGQIVVGDIGIRTSEDRPVAETLTDADAARLLPAPAATVHKRSRGVVVIVAGSPGMSGAAVLAARGALAAGAGLVTVCTAEAARQVVASAIPEVLTVPLPPDDPEAAFRVVEAQCDRADALTVGPGLGQTPVTVSLVRRLVADIPLPMIVDADGLNAFAGDADALAEHQSPLLTLTPHAGEYARLSPTGFGDRVTGAIACAARWRAVVVAKGPGTVTAGQDGRMWINDSGTAALATGGTGDVLSGMLAAVVADQADAARVAAGVHLHGRAGEAAAALTHPRSVTAGTVADAVADAWQRLDYAGEVGS